MVVGTILHPQVLLKERFELTHESKPNHPLQLHHEREKQDAYGVQKRWVSTPNNGNLSHPNHDSHAHDDGMNALATKGTSNHDL